MNKAVVINAELCNGCGICELVCALSTTGQWHPSLSRIKILADGQENLYLPLTCIHCINPPCATACLMNVIKKDPETGLTIRDEASCIGCRACEINCPFGACVYDYIEEIVVNCDLCGGNPACVQHCPTGALNFMEIEEMMGRRREKTAHEQVVKGMKA